MAVDGMLGNAQAAGDFLGVQVFRDQPEAFPLTRSEPIHSGRIVLLPHNG